MILRILLIFIGLIIGRFVYTNHVVKPSTSVQPELSVPLIDEIIRRHASLYGIADDDPSQSIQPLIPYRNHCYRVYNVAVRAFLETKLTNKDKELIAIALGFHDLGLFTHNTLDYLPPSIELVEKWMNAKGGFSKDDIEKVRLMIEYHHKVTAYEGPHADLVERVRKADWTDVTMGMMTFEADSGTLKTLRDAFPIEGFYSVLVKAEVLWLFSNPLRPIPFVRL